MEIQHFSHKHTLTFCILSAQEADDHKAPPRCNGCAFSIGGPAYTCAACSFWLHKSCSELPREIEKHPLHSAHSLSLHYSPQDVDNAFICDGCQELCFGLKYFCKCCGFFLGTTCACLSYEEAEASKGTQAKTTIQHFSHFHNLTWCSVREELSISCWGCKEVILGAAYVCLDCGFLLHESCVNEMPQEVEHPFHPQHHLRPRPMGENEFERCNACYENIWHIKFICDRHCSFYLHASCVKYKTRAIRHQFHEHNLLYFGPKNIGRCLKCHSCGQDCNASFFCCVICEVDIHLECLPLPLIVKHNRHFHLLTLTDSVVDDLEEHYCDICETRRNPEHHVYFCEECNYTAHIDCVISQVEPLEKIVSNLVPRSKVESKHEKIEESSNIIYSDIEEESGTSIFTKKLSLVKLNDEDNDVKDYNAVGEENNQEKAAKQLEESEGKGDLFLSDHTEDLAASNDIEDLVLSDDTEDLFLSDHTEDLVLSNGLSELEEEIKDLQEEMEELTAKLAIVQVKLKKLVDPSSLLPSQKTAKMIQHFSHQHTLIFCMLSDQKFYNCKVCDNDICGLAYTCKDRSCYFYLHKSCSELPTEIEKHPLHPMHTLLLIPNHDPYKRYHNYWWMCDGCQQVSDGPKYICKWCRYTLDIKCAFLTVEKALALTCGSVKTTILHFSHKHHLTRCIIQKFKFCNGCEMAIFGPAYACFDCSFFLHESCLNDMPQEVETPFHPQHHLLPQPIGIHVKTCNACKQPIEGISFSCGYCSFYLHVSCTKYQTRAIKHQFHEHNLLYLEPIVIGRCCKCYSCGESCIGSCFSCIICQVDIHLECLPLPLTVKHKRHFHPLTFKYLIVEDDLGGYYCDLCETKRNPRHHVYYCEKCDYIAHIDCVISQVEPPEEILSYLAPDTMEVDTMEVELEFKKIQHFSHTHQLTLFSFADKLKGSCNGCKEVITGPVFACLSCMFFLHESCLNDMPRSVKTPFHPQHHLLSRPMKTFDSRRCSACYDKIRGIIFKCNDCSFYLHASCAKYQTRAIKHEFHEHDLFYFGQKSIGRHRKCCSCSKSCKTSFFCCIVCQVDIHLECLSLPLTIKHNRHFHPLTLKDQIVGDDSGECYCDFCMVEINSEYLVYY